MESALARRGRSMNQADEHPRADVLGRLLVLQQALGVLERDKQICDFLQEVFEDVPGVSECCVQIDRHGEAPSSQQAEPDDAGGSAPIARIAIGTATAVFGTIRFVQYAPDVFERYAPFLVNIGQMVGTILEARRNAAGLSDANQRLAQLVDQLESRVNERTRDIWKQANFDALTGLPNRRLFLDRLEIEAKRSRRNGVPFALVFVDLDRFKEINDTLGHVKGDLLLIEAGERLLACLRRSDSVARFAGDEFTAILRDSTSAGDVEAVVQRMLRALAQPFDLHDGHMGYVSASAGVAFCPSDAASAEDLLICADQAMYAAKAAGRNTHRYFTPAMKAEVTEKSLLTNDLRHALKRQQLEVFYQGIVDAATGQIVKAEALLRWHHPLRGIVGPATFVPLAEESGLIVEIGEWVFQEAIRSVERWRRNTGRLIQVSVNKSPIQFFRSDPGRWLDALERSGLPPCCIAVEITEGLLIQNVKQVNDQLMALRQSGIEVSIDDFGTGFSSFAYLNQFPIDYLKIDRSFVNRIGDSDSARAVTEAMIVMAHKLGLQTIAEGVESEAQREPLARQGCDFMQGFLFCRPVPSQEFEALLAASSNLPPRYERSGNRGGKALPISFSASTGFS